jgi:copper chaperone NosL
MSRVIRWVLALASVAVLGVYAFPLWRVTLEAPQYPEGIGMLIHVSGVSGVQEHDLDNINGLNHYIGMARIEPDAIPELRFMPWVAAGIVLSGLLIAWRGSRRMAIGWATVVLATLCAGVYDFWRWEYNFGHNLSPDAAIRIPGLTYQPPLFGSKQILNFVAHSYPAAGGWLLIAAGVTIGSVLLYLLFGTRRPKSAVVRARAPMAAATLPLITALLLSACGAVEPRALRAGSDACAQCRMMITDTRFGAQVISRTGRIQTFDAVECLAAYVAEADSTSLRSVWVNNFERPGEWIAADAAVFVAAASIASPMGRSLLALGTGTTPESARARYGGRVTEWRALVAAARMQSPHAADAGGPQRPFEAAHAH